MKLFKHLVLEINEWQSAIFTQATPLSAAIHLQRESAELISDVEKGDLQQAKLELADCFLLISAVAHLLEIDLEEAIEDKMKINRLRKWNKPDAQGVVEHVKESQ